MLFNYVLFAHIAPMFVFVRDAQQIHDDDDDDDDDADAFGR